MHQESPNDIAVIEWHKDDEFEFPVSPARISYYYINGYPTSVFDGGDKFAGGIAPNNYSVYKPVFDERLTTPSNFVIDMEITNLKGTDYNVTATIEMLEGNTSDDLVALVALTETDCPSPGYANQNFVARAAYPDQYGTPVDFSTQTTQTVNQTITLDDEWVFENCEVVVLLQNMDTREIYQATSLMMTDIVTGINEDFAKHQVEVYPNPANGIVNIKSTEEILKVAVYNQSGQRVYCGSAGSKLYHFSTTGLNPGLYLFKIDTQQGIVTKRIVVM